MPSKLASWETMKRDQLSRSFDPAFIRPHIHSHHGGLVPSPQERELLFSPPFSYLQKKLKNLVFKIYLFSKVILVSFYQSTLSFHQFYHCHSINQHYQ